MKKKKIILQPSDWGLSVSSAGQLMIRNFSLAELADLYGTPLYVLDEIRLKYRAESFNSSAANSYPGKVSVHYPFKCSSVSEVVNIIRSSGLKAEVMTEFELSLALFSGYSGHEIIVNGPCKTDSFLNQCLDAGVKLISIDSIDELKSLSALTVKRDKKVNLLLRINPDIVPEGIPAGTAAGSAKSVFGLGLSLKSMNEAIEIIRQNSRLYFEGFHFHIGTGIISPDSYQRTIKKLSPLITHMKSKGFKINIIDTGGGYPSPATRQLRTKELIAAKLFSRYQFKQSFNPYTFDDFTMSIGRSISELFPGNLPELIFEPGRSIVSSCQTLLLKAHRIKENSCGKWVITDGGLGTITLPAYYEYHKIFLANNVRRPYTKYYSLAGPCCFSGDIIYKNLFLPHINQGEIIAMMDTGAYFNGMESNFGFARPAIIAVSADHRRLIRERESISTMAVRDLTFKNDINREVSHEIQSY
jgi:diaminopimelate decarboxylase